METAAQVSGRLFVLAAINDTAGLSDRLRARILDAAFEQFCLVGIRRSSIDDVARRAKVGRVTIYRRFASKEQLVSALLWRETRATIEAVAAAVRDVTDVEERFVAGFVAGMQAIRRHPLIGTMLATEPETALPLLTLEGSGGLALARTFIATEVRRARGDLELSSDDCEEVAELFARLTHSLLLTPETRLSLDSDERTREFARRHIVPMVTGRPARQR
jgi:AcrR family transcriptional regulator